MEMRNGSNRPAGVARRIAGFLNWGAVHQPRRIMTFEKIAQVVFDLREAPEPQSDLVKRVQEFTYKARPILARRHGRELVTEPGVGARASVDALDALMSGMVRDLDRLATHVTSVARTYALVRHGGVDWSAHPAITAALDDLGAALEHHAFPMLAQSELLKRAINQDTRRAARALARLPIDQAA